MINQKVYWLFWFWLSLLITASFLMLSLRVTMIFSTEARLFRAKYLYRVEKVQVRHFGGLHTSCGLSYYLTITLSKTLESLMIDTKNKFIDSLHRMGNSVLYFLFCR